MTAKEARELSDFHLKKVTTKEFEEVMIKIIEATKKGEYYVHYGYLTGNCIKRLQGEGYKVNSDNHRNETVTFISW